MKRALIATTAALVALSSGSALAAQPETFVGDANAVGLELTIQGSGSIEGGGLTIGYSEAIVEESGEGAAAERCAAEGAVSCAIAAGELALGDTASSWWPGNAGTNSATAFALPPDVSELLTAEIGEAVATTAEAPRAIAEGGAAELTVTATQTLYNALPQELRDGLEELTTTLEEQASSDPTDLIERAFATTDQLRENIESAPILQVYAGGSNSISEVDGDVTTSTAEAIGSTIVVAPFADSTETNPQGLVIIEIGKATATATSDQFQAAADFSPAIVTLRVLNPATGEYDVQDVEGETACPEPLVGTPLEVCVTAGSGSKTVDGSSAAARADAVRVEAFPDTLAVSFRAASAEVGVASTPTPAPPPEPEEPNMPRTGGGLMLPGLLLLGGALGLRRLKN